MRIDRATEFKEVYIAESPNKMIPLEPLAIWPKIESQGDNRLYIEWGDTANGNHFTCKQIDVTGETTAPEMITLETDQGEIILHRVTKKLFDSDAKNRLMGHPEFSSVEEIRNYYLGS